MPQPRVIAALGPRMLELAQQTCAGAHPYLVPPDHTRQAREMLGPDTWLCVEQKVVLESDASRARSIARRGLALYLGLENYPAHGGAVVAINHTGYLDWMPAALSAYQVRRRLRSALDASRRHHVADVRFYELLSEPDVTSGSVKLRRHPRR